MTPIDLDQFDDEELDLLMKYQTPVPEGDIPCGVRPVYWENKAQILLSSPWGNAYPVVS